MNKKIKDNHISKKKKNTYIVNFNILLNMDLFSMCKTTPIPISIINGQIQNKNNTCIKSIEFPNPYANEMMIGHDRIQKKMGDKISSTIIEYLDKDTLKPVVYVYPESVHVRQEYKQNFLQHLNHATERDFIKEVNKRNYILGTVNMVIQR